MDLNLLIFPNFEPLDLFGPVEVLGDIESCRLRYFSLDGGPVSCRQSFSILTAPSRDADPNGILLIPGGMGTRPLSQNQAYLEEVRRLAQNAPWVLTVCTGVVLLAKTGLLDGRHATGNKRSFDWVKNSNSNVLWERRARWVKDGRFYTASGVSAGIDMAFAFVADQWGPAKADAIAKRMEYVRHTDPAIDPFA